MVAVRGAMHPSSFAMSPSKLDSIANIILIYKAISCKMFWNFADVNFVICFFSFFFLCVCVWGGGGGGGECYKG